MKNKYSDYYSLVRSHVKHCFAILTHREIIVHLERDSYNEEKFGAKPVGTICRKVGLRENMTPLSASVLGAFE